MFLLFDLFKEIYQQKSWKIVAIKCNKLTIHLDMAMEKSKILLMNVGIYYTFFILFTQIF